MQSALGLLQLKHVKLNIEKRKEIADFYSLHLSEVKGIRLLENNTDYQSFNYSYYPIFIDELYNITRDEVYSRLKEHKIFARRYF